MRFLVSATIRDGHILGERGSAVERDIFTAKQLHGTFDTRALRGGAHVAKMLRTARKIWTRASRASRFHGSGHQLSV